MIEEGKRQNANELTEIHRKLIEQREFYEQDLRNKLAEANRFASDFADLHIDMATKRIADDTTSRREELKTQEMSEYKLLTENEQLRKKLINLQRDHEIYVKSVKAAESKAGKMKQQVEEIESQLTTGAQDPDDRLRSCRDENEFRIKELTERVAKMRNVNVELKQQAAIAAREFAQAQERKYDNMRKEYELVAAMSDAAVFVLTALDKKIGKVNNPEIQSTKSALNKIIQRLTLIAPWRPAPRRVRTVDTRDQGVQTEKPFNPVLFTGKVKEPGSTSVSNPRTRGMQSFKNAAEYRRVYRTDTRKKYGNTVFYKRT